MGNIRPLPHRVQHLRGVHGVLWLEPFVLGERHGSGALHWSHQTHLPLHGLSPPPHEKAAGPHLAASSRGGSAARAAVETLQGSELQELLLLPLGGTQRLAGCLPASALLSAGATGPASLHCLQYSDELHSAAGQTAPQASPQRHFLPRRDDLPAPGHHVGILCVLGTITGKNLFSGPLTLPYDIKRKNNRVQDDIARALFWLAVPHSLML